MATYDLKFCVFLFCCTEVENIKSRPELTLEEVSLDNRDSEDLDNFLNN